MQVVCIQVSAETTASAVAVADTSFRYVEKKVVQNVSLHPKTLILNELLYLTKMIPLAEGSSPIGSLEVVFSFESWQAGIRELGPVNLQVSLDDLPGVS